jgi:PleD family two-component response regulator
MIMPEMSGAAAAQRAERLLEATRLLTVEHGGRPLGRITVSAGVALFPDHGLDGPALLQAADSALYAAKEAGRDRVMVAKSPGDGGQTRSPSAESTSPGSGEMSTAPAPGQGDRV